MPHKMMSGLASFTVNRRRFPQTSLAAGAAAAGIPGELIPPTSAAAQAPPGGGAAQVEDIRSSQNTILEAMGGQIEKVRSGALLFQDSKDTLGDLPEEFLGRSFIRSVKGETKAVCRQAGYVYAASAAGGATAKRLTDGGFKQLDLPAFEIFQGQSGIQALAFQKRLNVGERLDLGNWAIVIFGPEERSGVPFAKMRSLAPPPFSPMAANSRPGKFHLHFRARTT
jgi:hypothetical protein